MFRIEMLPASDGDCLWIEYGPRRRPRRILIDGGRSGTYKALKRKFIAIPEGKRHVDLFILTHVDSDHIAGAIKFFQDERLSVTFGDIWFNGRQHLRAGFITGALGKENHFTFEAFGPQFGSRKAVTGGFLSTREGNRYADILRRRQLPWNQAFGGRSVVVINNPPVRSLADGMTITILSPTVATLSALRSKWREEISLLHANLEEEERAEVSRFRRRDLTESMNIEELADRKFDPDNSAANGSSIAVMAEYRRKRVLLTGDAFAPVLIESLKQILGSRQRLKVHALKVSHHGSTKNINPELLRLIDCDRYLISTNGNRHHHPDRDAIARLIKYGGAHPKLYFNYKTKYNNMWERNVRDYPYDSLYPKNNDKGMIIDL